VAHDLDATKANATGDVSATLGVVTFDECSLRLAGGASVSGTVTFGVSATRATSSSWALARHTFDTVHRGEPESTVSVGSQGVVARSAGMARVGDHIVSVSTPHRSTPARLADLLRLAALQLPHTTPWSSKIDLSQCDPADAAVTTLLGEPAMIRRDFTDPSGLPVCGWASDTGGVQVRAVRSSDPVSAIKALRDQHRRVPGVGRYAIYTTGDQGRLVFATAHAVVTVEVPVTQAGDEQSLAAVGKAVQHAY
jgi:hypothetical protein